MTKILVSVLAIAFFHTVVVAGPLHIAVKDGDVDQVKTLLSEGEDANKRDRSLGWPLHQAALNDNIEITEMLIAAGADVKAVHKIFGTPLHAAALKGNFSVAASLLKNGADPNSRYNYGLTPLHLAAEKGHANMIELLVVIGSDIDASTTKLDPLWADYTATQMAGREGHFDIVALLQSLQASGAPDQPISTLLAIADIEAGRVAFGNLVTPGNPNCSGGHSFIETGQKLNGPNLIEIVGRPKASAADFEYSEALKRLGGVWTTSELNAFIAGAIQYAPGSKMEIWGIADPVKRANIIAYLQSLSD